MRMQQTASSMQGDLMPMSTTLVAVAVGSRRLLQLQVLDLDSCRSRQHVPTKKTHPTVETFCILISFNIFPVIQEIQGITKRILPTVRAGAAWRECEATWVERATTRDFSAQAASLASCSLLGIPLAYAMLGEDLALKTSSFHNPPQSKSNQLPKQ